MPEQRVVELEMVYTDWEGSCHDATLLPGADFRECRRPKGHAARHASGFGIQYREWD